jgi:translation initiation factor 4E
METNMNLSTQLSNNWTIWYHFDKDNWKINGFKQIVQIKTVGDFWKFYNNWDKVGGITYKHFFIMKHNVAPIWEDDNNRTGGCWSFKVQDDVAESLWEDLSVHLMCNTLCPTISDELMGLSICSKKNNNVVIKIWNKYSKNNSLKLINDKILNKWGMDIIYIAHMSEN